MTAQGSRSLRNKRARYRQGLCGLTEQGCRTGGGPGHVLNSLSLKGTASVGEPCPTLAGCTWARWEGQAEGPGKLPPSSGGNQLQWDPSRMVLGQAPLAGGPSAPPGHTCAQYCRHVPFIVHIVHTCAVSNTCYTQGRLYAHMLHTHGVCAHAAYVCGLCVHMLYTGAVVYTRHTAYMYTCMCVPFVCTHVTCAVCVHTTCAWRLHAHMLHVCAVCTTVPIASPVLVPFFPVPGVRWCGAAEAAALRPQRARG